MNPVSSPLQVEMPDEVNLHILSFLDKRDLQSIACTCGLLKGLSEDYQIWKPKAESDFGRIVALGSKMFSMSWKQTYEALDKSKTNRTEHIGEVLKSHVNKVKRDDIQYRTNTFAAALLGFAAPDPGTHYYPTGQTGMLGNHKITVYRNNNG